MKQTICEIPPMFLLQDKQRGLAAAFADLSGNASVAAEPDARTAAKTAGDHL